jgi:hypothetical protein
VKEYRALQNQHVLNKYNYYENTDHKVVKAINQRRVGRGKRSFRKLVSPEKRRPLTSFLR